MSASTPSLFETFDPVPTPSTNDLALSRISGLCYRDDFVNEEQESYLLKQIDASPWLGDLDRRVQHYGYKYDYRSRRIDPSMRVGNLPDWMLKLAQKLHDAGWFNGVPDQVIVNEYEPGQGIMPHIDCEPCFGDTIVSISLASGAVMDFTNVQTEAKLPVWLARRSAVVLKGDSRYMWKHSIPKRKKDLVSNLEIARSRRVSLTFREVVLQGSKISR